MTPESVKALLHKIAATMENVGPLVAFENAAAGAELVAAGKAIDAIPLDQIQTIFDKVETGVDLVRSLIAFLQGKGLNLAAKWFTATGA